MMRVYFNPDDGSILYTISGEPAYLPNAPFVEVPDDTPLQYLSDWKIVGGELTFVSADETMRAFHDAVNRERDRRIVAGVEVTLPGYPGPVALQGRPEDLQSLQGLGMGALASITLEQQPNAPAPPFRDRNNVIHQLTVMQMLSLWRQGASYVSAVYQRSWVVKNMNPLFTDPADPTVWALT